MLNVSPCFKDSIGGTGRGPNAYRWTQMGRVVLDFRAKVATHRLVINSRSNENRLPPAFICVHLWFSAFFFCISCSTAARKYCGAEWLQPKERGPLSPREPTDTTGTRGLGGPRSLPPASFDNAFGVPASAGKTFPADAGLKRSSIHVASTSYWLKPGLRTLHFIFPVTFRSFCLCIQWNALFTLS